MSLNLIATIINYICNFLAVLISLPCHEFAHAFAAVRNGDMTPKYSGRYTLNPFAHFDPLGLLMMVLVRFGWAKPVPVNPYNFRNYKKGLIEVSIAGVLTNLALAIIFCPLAILAGNITVTSSVAFPFLYFVYALPQSLFYLNVALFVFNLLPFYPLDGFRLIDSLTVKRGKVYQFLYRYGRFVLIGIILLGYMGSRFSIPQLNVLSYLIKWAAWPIEYLWRLII